MKIIYMTNADDKYGAPKSLMELVYNLRKNNGIEPIVLTSKRNKVNEFCDENKIENYVAHYSNCMINKEKNIIKTIIKYNVRLIQYIIGNIRANTIVKKNINLKEIDYIHTNTTVIDFGQKLSKKYNIPHIQHIREFGEKDYSFMPLFKKQYYNNSNLYTKQFIAISEAVKKYWVEKGIDKNKIKVIYNGLDLQKILPKEKNKDQKNLKIIFTGSINESKGQHQLIEALNLLEKDDLKRIKVDIYGDGKPKYLKKLKDKVTEYKLDNYVSFKGFHKNIPSILKDYDIGVVCSKSEGFGRVTVEYMAAGLCPVVSDTGANPEIITNDYNGFIYKYNDFNNLAQILTKLINKEKNIETIVENAKNDAQNKYTTEINSKNIYNLYKEKV